MSHIRRIAHVPARNGWNSSRFKLTLPAVLAEPTGYQCYQMIKQGAEEITNSPYVRAMPLSHLNDLDLIERVLSAGNVLIIKITPIAKRSVEETKIAINRLTDFSKRQGGDIARLGEERVVLTPPGIRIWRKKTGATGKSSAPEIHGS